jgi:hypothetical protein
LLPPVMSTILPASPKSMRFTPFEADGRFDDAWNRYRDTIADAGKCVRFRKTR